MILTFKWDFFLQELIENLKRNVWHCKTIKLNEKADKKEIFSSWLSPAHGSSCYTDFLFLFLFIEMLVLLCDG